MKKHPSWFYTTLFLLAALFLVWLGGYNFDRRGPDVAWAAYLVLGVAAAIFMGVRVASK